MSDLERARTTSLHLKRGFWWTGHSSCFAWMKQTDTLLSFSLDSTRRPDGESWGATEKET
jgi:hypothetical protein